MTNARESMLRHVDALFTSDAHGDLLRVNEPNGAPAPRFFLGRTVRDAICRFRADVGAEARRELRAAVEHHVPNLVLDKPMDSAPYEAILARLAPVQRVATGPAFSFPEVLPDAGGTTRITESNTHLLLPLLDAWIPDVASGAPMIAVVADDRAVAVCCSVRRTGAAHEAGVETSPAYRGRGYAPRVVAEWGRAVRELGSEPLYSTSWSNTSSRAVARKCGLIRFGNDLHIT